MRAAVQLEISWLDVDSVDTQEEKVRAWHHLVLLVVTRRQRQQCWQLTPLCVEADTDTGKVNTVEHVLRVPEKSPPNVDAFFIPHGITSDLDFQELNTATRRSSRANSSGSLRDGNGRDSTTGAEGSQESDDSNDLFPGAFAYNLMFSPPGGSEGKTWSAAVLVNPRERLNKLKNLHLQDCIVFTGRARFACEAAEFALQCMHREDEDKDVDGGEKSADSSIVGSLRGCSSSHPLFAPVTSFARQR